MDQPQSHTPISFQDFVASPDLMAAYQAWLRDPITARVFDFARDRVLSSLLGGTPPGAVPEETQVLEKGAIQYATTWGRLECLDFMSNLSAFRPVEELPPSSYETHVTT